MLSRPAYVSRTTSRTENVTVRVSSTNWEHWNHEWRTIPLLPVFWTAGHVIGFLGGVHLSPAVIPDEIVAGLFGVLALLLGGIFLALIDHSAGLLHASSAPSIRSTASSISHASVSISSAFSGASNSR